MKSIKQKQINKQARKSKESAKQSSLRKITSIDKFLAKLAKRWKEKIQIDKIRD